jgi:GH35 family endo-1,4-beta-xylanase
LVNNLKTRDVLIQGILFKIHIIYNQIDMSVISAINKAIATGLMVNIAELDVVLITDINPTLTHTATLADQQSAKYKYMIKAYYGDGAGVKIINCCCGFDGVIKTINKSYKATLVKK